VSQATAGLLRGGRLSATAPEPRRTHPSGFRGADSSV
jgi:hypothetical protein